MFGLLHAVHDKFKSLNIKFARKGVELLALKWVGWIINSHFCHSYVFDQ